MKYTRIMALALILLLAVGACTGCMNAEKKDRSAPAVDYDTVVVAVADEAPSLEPAAYTAMAGEHVNRLTHNGLFRIDENLNPVPDLVKSYTYDESTYTWTFTLHPGIKFHDGTHLTADDVVATLNHSKTMPHVEAFTTTYHNVTKVDDLTISLNTQGPSVSLLYDLTHHGNYIIPKEYIDQGRGMEASPVGSGPYRFVSWDRGEKITLTAFPEYFDKERAARIQNVVWRIIPEGAARTMALESGEVDFLMDVDSIAIRGLQENPDVVLDIIESVSHFWLTLNTGVPPFDDINVRRALNCAINREDIIAVALNGAGVPALSQTPMGMLGENTQNFGGGYDVELAREYLAKWGGDPSDIDLEIICSNDTKRRAAEVIQYNLKALGIETKIVNVDLATYMSKMAAGTYVSFIGGYAANDMLSFIKTLYHSSSAGALNSTREPNPEIDRLVELADKTMDRAEREKVLKEASKVLNDHCYQVPLYQDSVLTAHKNQLSNARTTPTGYISVNEWYWEAGET